MNKLAARIKKYWEGCNPGTAHLGISGEAERLVERSREILAGKLRITGKTFIDFGCGGGLTGLFLLGEGAGRYVAYDVAERSISRASEALDQYSEKTKFILLENHVWDFAAEKPYALIALAVTWHFPNVKYFNNFLSSCETSGAKFIVIEIRDKNRGTIASPVGYTGNFISMSAETCLVLETDEKYVSDRLPSYELTASETPNENGCQVLWYKKRRA
jgi:cyclopropane fatty-acyl-phospholipid synthase-like methyltransferase